MYLSIVIPAYNEEKRIEKTLEATSAYLAAQPYEYEIILVSDGSTDATVAVVRSLNIPHLNIIDNKENNGKGFVVRQGLLAARGQYRLFMDADNATPVNEVEKLLVEVGTHDLVIGSRRGGSVVLPQPLHRRVLGKLYSLLVKTITGLYGISDTQCGFKLLTDTATENVLSQCRANGWSFDVEMLLIAKRQGFLIKEVPVAWSDGKDTKLKLRGMIDALLELLTIRWNAIIGIYG